MILFYVNPASGGENNIMGFPKGTSIPFAIF